MIIHDCIPCQYGDHDNHVDTPEPAPKGMMGGWSCACRGECRYRPQSELHGVREAFADRCDA